MLTLSSAEKKALATTLLGKALTEKKAEKKKQ
jgi:hypothetical protein